MGTGRYSRETYTARMDAHTATGTDPMAHTRAVNDGTAKSVLHEKLDPSRKNAAGHLIRESCDSVDSPNSRAIAVLFDVTGSMRDVPRLFQQKLAELMAFLVMKNYVPDPHILMGAIGDATCDRVPLQVGQFEASNEMDEALSLIYCEGGGGGQNTESYELAMYYMARHTRMDCFEKRGEKAYLFLTGDECPYAHVKKSEVKKHIGDTLEADIPTVDILEELRQKYEVFWIVPGGTSHFADETVLKPLRGLFGQNLLKLENPSEICELIASTVGVAEGHDIHDVAGVLRSSGAKHGAVDNAVKALAVFADGRAVAKNSASVSGTLVEAGCDAIERL